MKIPVNKPSISKEAKEYANKALDDGWISSSGLFVKEFEDKFAEWLGVDYAVAVSSGTAALHITLKSLGIGKGDEVIVPAFTMGSVWSAVLYTGAKPVFIDCSLKDWNIDIDQIQKKVNSKTKAIIPVHTYGYPCNMGEIMNIASWKDLFVIEDACEAIGAVYRDKKCGTLGHVSCFSFFANKTISTGEGGMVCTNDVHLAGNARSFRDLCHSSTRFIHEGIGFNYRMTNLQAAVGCGELEHINDYLATKEMMKKFYDENLADIEGLTTQVEIRGREPVCWMYGMLVDELSYGMTKDELRTVLEGKGIETRDFFYPPEKQIVLKDMVKSNFINANYLSRNGLYIPSGLDLSLEDMGKVVAEIRKYHNPKV